MSFCLIFRLPSQILAFIRGLPDFFVFCFNRLPSVSINFYLSFCEKNLVLPFPSLEFLQAQVSYRGPSLRLLVLGELNRLGGICLSLSSRLGISQGCQCGW